MADAKDSGEEEALKEEEGQDKAGSDREEKDKAGKTKEARDSQDREGPISGKEAQAGREGKATTAEGTGATEASKGRETGARELISIHKVYKQPRFNSCYARKEYRGRIPRSSNKKTV